MGLVGGLTHREPVEWGADIAQSYQTWGVGCGGGCPVGRCENIKRLKMYFPQMILGVRHKNKTLLPKKICFKSPSSFARITKHVI